MTLTWTANRELIWRLQIYVGTASVHTFPWGTFRRKSYELRRLHLRGPDLLLRHFRLRQRGNESVLSAKSARASSTIAENRCQLRSRLLKSQRTLRVRLRFVRLRLVDSDFDGRFIPTHKVFGRCSNRRSNFVLSRASPCDVPPV